MESQLENANEPPPGAETPPSDLDMTKSILPHPITTYSNTNYI